MGGMGGMEREGSGGKERDGVIREDREDRRCMGGCGSLSYRLRNDVPEPEISSAPAQM